MISFITKQLEDPRDLLELYCGCGGFTLPLASKFNKVFATGFFFQHKRIHFNEKDITETENESVVIDPDPNLLQVMEKFEINKPMTSFFTPNRLMTPGTNIKLES